MRPISLPVLAVIASLSLVAACGSEADSDSQVTQPSSSSSSSSSSSLPSSSSATDDASTNAKDGDVVANPPSKSWKDAVKAAKNEFVGDVAKIELEHQDNGGMEYKVELLSQDTKYAVQYDADTLAKLSDKRDGLGDDAAEKRKKPFDPNSLIDLGKAADAARKQQDGTIREWKIEGKDTGRVRYGFDIRPAGASQDAEVEINARDGSLVKDS